MDFSGCFMSYCFIISSFFMAIDVQDYKSLPASSVKRGCSPGWWGKQCASRCRCLFRAEHCDQITGKCTSGCQVGYHGPGCQKLCSGGWYGVNCSQKCSHCRYGRCNPFTGDCPGGCKWRWKGSLCQTNCAGSKSRCPVFCGHCLGGANFCDMATGVCDGGGCLPGWTGINCNINCHSSLPRPGCGVMCGGHKERNVTCDLAPIYGCQQEYPETEVNRRCESQTGQCGHCLGGNGHCDVPIGECSDGCQAGSARRSCGLHMAKLRWDSATQGSRWMWIVVCIMMTSVLVVIFIAKFSFRRSNRSRRRYVKEMFNKLTSDDSFRYINPRLMQRSRRVKEPRFDIKSLSRQNRKTVLEQLDYLLGENEQYEDFIRSNRYKELRVIVANKAWATDHEANLIAQSIKPSEHNIGDAISRWKLKYSRSLESQGDLQDIAVKEPANKTSGILRGSKCTDTSSMPFRRRQGGSVRFSSAASMVIFPEYNTPSSSGSIVSRDRDIMTSFSKAAAALSSFISDEKSKTSASPPSPELDPSFSSVDASNEMIRNNIVSEGENVDVWSPEMLIRINLNVDSNPNRCGMAYLMPPREEVELLPETQKRNVRRTKAAELRTAMSTLRENLYLSVSERKLMENRITSSGSLNLNDVSLQESDFRNDYNFDSI